ncbi:SWIM zinc finger family protein [Halobaculum limi]|uniref:SWIM zinc finger family protein n=1 Tax=Halobaculum limi TaxID=3031916 RepID=UPI002406766D|nr:SWIM zinc finger family protein [Halobaculum sp. YSMS11]
MSTPRTPPSTDEQAPGTPLDFEALAGSDATSWDRADPQGALIESVSRYSYRVTLPDGEDAHLVAIANDDGQHVGTCDCKAFEYHNGPCAHLCTVRQAAFIAERDTRGERVRIAHLHMQEGEYDEGREYLRKAVRVRPTPVRAVAYLSSAVSGELYLQLTDAFTRVRDAVNCLRGEAER